MRRLLGALLGLAVLAVLAACSGGAAGPDLPDGAREVAVETSDDVRLVG